MPCITAEGLLNNPARLILEALDEPNSLVEVARATHLPLYRVRSAIRELEDAGLVEPRTHGYVATDKGRALAERAAIHQA